MRPFNIAFALSFPSGGSSIDSVPNRITQRNTREYVNAQIKNIAATRKNGANVEEEDAALGTILVGVGIMSSSAPILV